MLRTMPSPGEYPPHPTRQSNPLPHKVSQVSLVFQSGSSAHHHSVTALPSDSGGVRGDLLPARFVHEFQRPNKEIEMRVARFFAQLAKPKVSHFGRAKISKVFVLVSGQCVGWAFAYVQYSLRVLGSIRCARSLSQGIPLALQVFASTLSCW